MYLVCIWCVVLAASAQAYSVLSHEAIVDAAWEDSIKPALLKRFPTAGDDELRKAHAFAYGGSIVQDLGYYPFGSELFSELTHYVRSGEFVVKMLSSAQDLNEYAFALGALAHYVGDITGHPAGINRAVAVIYPKLQRKFGTSITYADNRAAHMKAEFGFDVVQVANRRYAPEAYHDFVGFEVSRPLLERAFAATYGLKLDDVMLSVDLALGTYRYTVSTLLPNLTKAAWSMKSKEIQQAQPGITRTQFIYNMSRASFEREWGRNYEKPSICARMLGFFIRILPKVGPLRAFAFRVPTAEAEKLFMASFNMVLSEYRERVAQVASGGQFALANRNLDTGNMAVAGEYKLADETRAELNKRLAANGETQ
jgi:hypothetical protein